MTDLFLQLERQEAQNWMSEKFEKMIDYEEIERIEPRYKKYYSKLENFEMMDENPEQQAADIATGQVLSTLEARERAKEEQEFDEMDIEFDGEKMIFPKDMPLDKVERFVKRRRKQDETEVTINITIDALPLDGAAAFHRALKSEFGWSELKTGPAQGNGMFSMPGNPPTMVDVPISPTESIQVPWGHVQIPGVEGSLETSWERRDDGLPIFRLTGSVKRKSQGTVNKIAEATRREVRENSLYKGKAIRINFRDKKGALLDDLGPDFQPTFIDLTKIEPEKIVYCLDNETELRVNLFGLIENLDEVLQDDNLELKRSVLIHGQYGTGKSMTADKLAYMCVRAGMTFLLVEDARDITMGLGYAEAYGPSLLFAEDVDVIFGRNRDEKMNALFNRVCGVESKKREVITVLTTNELAMIHPGFIRPGRLDAVIELKVPDNKAIIGLVRQYGGENVTANDNEIVGAMEPIAGANAAFIVEAVRRCRYANLGSDDKTINAKALHASAASMLSHVRLIYPNAGTGGFDPAKYEVVHPGQMVMEVLGLEVAKGFINQMINPHFISGVIRERGNPPSDDGFHEPGDDGGTDDGGDDPQV